MKKEFILLLITVVIILTIIFSKYVEYSKIKLETQRINKEFLAYQNSTVQINTVVSLMGKAVEINKNNSIKQNDKKHFEENDVNSIKIYLEVQSTKQPEFVVIPMEDLILNEKAGATKVENAFNDCLFRITKIEYHKKTKQVKQIVFTEILN